MVHCSILLLHRGALLSAHRPDRVAEPDIHLASHVPPLLGCAQHGDQLIEETRMLGCELEPGQKVERPAELARVVEPPCASSARARSGRTRRPIRNRRYPPSKPEVLID